MAVNVNVERTAVQSGIRICDTSVHELQTAARNLTSSYQQAGSGGWKDQKYAQLGGIVEECTSALNQPVKELEDCKKSLEQLLRVIEGYEGISF